MPVPFHAVGQVRGKMHVACSPGHNRCRAASSPGTMSCLPTTTVRGGISSSTLPSSAANRHRTRQVSCQAIRRPRPPAPPASSSHRQSFPCRDNAMPRKPLSGCLPAAPFPGSYAPHRGRGLRSARACSKAAADVLGGRRGSSRKRSAQHPLQPPHAGNVTGRRRMSKSIHILYYNVPIHIYNV